MQRVTARFLLTLVGGLMLSLQPARPDTEAVAVWLEGKQVELVSPLWGERLPVVVVDGHAMVSVLCLWGMLNRDMPDRRIRRLDTHLLHWGIINLDDLSFKLGSREVARPVPMAACFGCVERFALPVAPRIISGHAYVPARATLNLLGYAVDWEPQQRAIHLTHCPRQHIRVPHVKTYPEMTGWGREGKDYYLYRGGERLLVSPWVPPRWGDREIGLPGAYRVLLQPRDASDPVVSLLRCGKPAGTISLNQVRDEKLKDDSFWGGHSEGNQMRYMHLRAGGIGLFITSAVPHRNAMLGVLHWYALGPSGQGILAQHLVRIVPAPNPQLEFLRRLAPLEYEMRQYHYSREPTPLLFRAGAKLLLYRSPNLVEIDQRGRELAIFARLPVGTEPVRLLDGRWLILWNPPRDAQAKSSPIWFLDVRTRRSRPLPGKWSGREIYRGDVYVPGRGGRILVHDSRARWLHVVTVPGGRRVAIPNPMGSAHVYIWRGMVVMKQDEWILLYDASSGKLLMKYPREGPPVVFR